MTVLQRQLGRRLRQLREATRKTDHDVEQSGLVSRAKLRRIETGHQPLKPDDVRSLCLLYGADAATTNLLARWAQTCKQPGWWEDFDRATSATDRLYAGLEPIADHLYIYELGQVPELLQTPGYTRSLYLAVKPDATQAAVLDHLTHQQERQAVLTERTPPMRLNAVLNENALTRPVGDPDVMREQIRHLSALTDRVHIDIRYLPWTAGAHPAMSAGGFTILEFTDPDDPDIVYAETLTGARYCELPAELDEYRRIFTDTYALSVPINDYRL